MGDLSWLRHVVRTGAVVGLLALGACGSDTAEEPAATVGSSPTAQTSDDAGADGLPACDDVWQTGETLPAGYAGCVQDGATVEVDALACSSGQKFVTFEESHYAVVGGLVREVEGEIDTDRAYRKAVRSCRA